ncbi:MAG: N-acetyl-gamma-glutamyl-phosphate reductase [Endomicrobiales bacterium]|nr:N-acetyl-gamma-glutamyl-phosphate reductase [Endomicrobiales bacterium]
MIKVAVVGAMGYTGEELIKILSGHPGAEITVVADKLPDLPKNLKEIYPSMKDLNLVCENLDVPSVSKKSDVVFLAVPHKVSLTIAPEFLKLNKKVIDLSADYRIESKDVYEKWYNAEHTSSSYLKEAIYGLPELYREKIKNAKLLANPGCYPTTIILGCAPAMKEKLVSADSVIVDAKSGVSGGGRKFVQEYYKTDHPNHKPYSIAGKHRHIPEVEQELSKIIKEPVKITFSPHIIPTERGMLSTIYMTLNKKIDSKDLIKIYQDFYKNEPFVRILPNGELPKIRDVVNTNYCDIGLDIDERTNKLIVVSSIDNLVKGASGQAVQNMNIMFGLKEKEGLN